MRSWFTSGFGFFLLFVSCASAHRLDEYLEATLISVQTDRAELSMRLVPGVAVSSTVLRAIDPNHDGVISEQEARAYSQQVVRDVRLSIDGHQLLPRVLAVRVPSIEEMRQGLGQIEIDLAINLPAGGPNRKLIFENHHQSNIAAYMVNCLVPEDPRIHIANQKRNESQSIYELDFTSAGDVVGSAGADLLFRFHGFVSMFRLGIRHIAEGTDHVLFLLSLLLPAPLFARGRRWVGTLSTPRAVLQILRVVTAFTAGHSITLALAAFKFVDVPSRLIEISISISIFVAAIHSIRPLFPGREAAIAALFGLIHGLAFASTLTELGLSRWERLISLVGFNIGIETMQLVIVLATLPSLVMLSQTRAYTVVRIGGGLFAAAASSGWVAERMLNLHNPVDLVVNGVAQHALWIGGSLFIIGVAAKLISPDESQRELVLSFKAPLR